MTEAPPPPSRAEVAAVLQAVLDGTMERTAASKWAAPWVAAVAPCVDDQLVWGALTKLGGIDLRHGAESPFLYDDEQLAEWRDELFG